MGEQGHGQGLIKPERHLRGCNCPENNPDAARDGQEVKEGRIQEGGASAYIGSSNLDRPMNPTSSHGTTFLGDFLSASFPPLRSHLIYSPVAVNSIPFEFWISPEGLIRRNPAGLKGFSDPLGGAEKNKNATKFRVSYSGFRFLGSSWSFFFNPAALGSTILDHDRCQICVRRFVGFSVRTEQRD